MLGAGLVIAASTWLLVSVLARVPAREREPQDLVGR
jgi:hypothetical protein